NAGHARPGRVGRLGGRRAARRPPVRGDRLVAGSVRDGRRVREAAQRTAQPLGSGEAVHDPAAGSHDREGRADAVAEGEASRGRAGVRQRHRKDVRRHPRRDVRRGPLLTLYAVKGSPPNAYATIGGGRSGRTDDGRSRLCRASASRWTASTRSASGSVYGSRRKRSMVPSAPKRGPGASRTPASSTTRASALDTGASS